VFVVVLILPISGLVYVLVGMARESARQWGLLVIVGVQAALWAGIWWIAAGALARWLHRLPAERRRRGLVLLVVLLLILGFLPVHGEGGHGSERWSSVYALYYDAFSGRLPGRF
jgi:cell division protein FtsW (lipid II flippase)